MTSTGEMPTNTMLYLFLMVLTISARGVCSCLGVGEHVRQRSVTDRAGDTCLNEVWYGKKNLSSKWLSICADTFDVNAANIWCRDLGFTRVSMIGESGEISQNSSLVVRLICSENATNIRECDIVITNSCTKVIHNTECERCTTVPGSTFECDSKCNNGTSCGLDLNIFEYKILIGVSLGVLSLMACCIAWSILVLSLRCIQCLGKYKSKPKKGNSPQDHESNTHDEEDYENNVERRDSAYRVVKKHQGSNSKNNRITEVHYDRPSPINAGITREVSYAEMISPYDNRDAMLLVNLGTVLGTNATQTVAARPRQQERRTSTPSYIELS